MNFHIADRQTLDLAAWAHLAESGSFFQTVEWADICKAGMSAAEKIVFFCGYDDGRMAAGMPAVITRKYGLASIASMPYGTYGGPLWTEDISEQERSEFLSGLSEYLDSHRFTRISIVDFPGLLSNWRPDWFECRRHFTHLIDLVAGEKFIPPGKKIIAELRAGEKAGGRIICVKNADQIGRFYDLYVATEDRHGHKKPLYDRRFFEAVAEVFADSEKLYWTALMAEGEMIGSQINFLHGTTLFYWQAVSDYEKRRYRPNYRLLYDAISKAASLGIRRVNLGASPPGAEGLIFFKERWGGQRFEYGELRRLSLIRKLMGR